MIPYRSIFLFYRERHNFLFTNVSLAALVLTAALIFVRLMPRTGLIPLHYNIFFGINKLGAWYEVLIYPVILLAIVALNFTFAYIIFARDKYLSYYLGMMSSVLGVLTFIYVLVLASYAA